MRSIQLMGGEPCSLQRICSRTTLTLPLCSLRFNPQVFLDRFSALTAEWLSATRTSRAKKRGGGDVAPLLFIGTALSLLVALTDLERHVTTFTLNNPRHGRLLVPVIVGSGRRPCGLQCFDAIDSE